ncbi:MAG: glycosyltransferase family 39 protein [Armatimonadetes bacterium]|nr:glycosyltransferase family 39 protein [Armatimonadota bacterium]MBX3109261.1 glycosyltransferase family 39 protein [Fimbriimonadaceae bacterium]
MKLPPALYAVLAVFLILTGVYSSLTPYRQGGFLKHQRDPATGGPQRAEDIGAPDERQHANYIAFVKSGKGFPVLVPGSPDAYENYQAHQPPLYYILGAGWSTVTGADPTDPGAGFRLRFLNSLIGIGTLLGIYFAGIWGLRRQDVALAATAFAALLPMNIALHAAVSNDPLLYCLVTWVFALSLKGIHEGWDNKVALTIGLLAGLGLLTKTTALVCFPVILGAFLISWRKNGAKPGLQAVALALVLPAILASPWLMRNKSLYGDFFALSVFNAAFTGSPQASLFIGALGAWGYWLNMVLWWTARSFVGAFGYMDVFLFDSMRPDQSGALYSAIFAILAGIVILGLLGLKAESAKAAEEDLPAPSHLLILSAVLLVFATALFIRFNMQYFQGQARYLFPALVAFSYFFAFGAVRLTKDKPQSAWIVPAVFLGLLNLAALQAISEGFPLRLGQ